VADGSVSVPMTLNDLERRDAMGHFFRRISGHFQVVPFDLERPISVGCVYARISWGQLRPYARGEAQAQPNFGGSLLFIHIPFDTEQPNLTW